MCLGETSIVTVRGAEAVTDAASVGGELNPIFFGVRLASLLECLPARPFSRRGLATPAPAMGGIHEAVAQSNFALALGRPPRPTLCAD